MDVYIVLHENVYRDDLNTGFGGVFSTLDNALERQKALLTSIIDESYDKEDLVLEKGIIDGVLYTMRASNREFDYEKDSVIIKKIKLDDFNVCYY